MKKLLFLFLYVLCFIPVQAQQYEVFGSMIINKEAVMAVEKDSSTPYINILLCPGKVYGSGTIAGWGGSASGMGTIVNVRYSNNTVRDEAFKKIFAWLNSK